MPSNHSVDEQAAKSENNPKPEMSLEPTLALEQSLNSGDGNDQVEEASVSSIQIDNFENEEASRENEVTPEPAVEDPVPRRTKEKRGVFFLLESSCKPQSAY